MGVPGPLHRTINDAHESAARAFAHAVAAERTAIRAHQQATVLHEHRAKQLGWLADQAVNGARRDSLLRQAETELTRANAASGRANLARQRLIDEGETP